MKFHLMDGCMIDVVSNMQLYRMLLNNEEVCLLSKWVSKTFTLAEALSGQEINLILLFTVCCDFRRTVRNNMVEN